MGERVVNSTSLSAIPLSTIFLVGEMPFSRISVFHSFSRAKMCEIFSPIPSSASWCYWSSSSYALLRRHLHLLPHYSFAFPHHFLRSHENMSFLFIHSTMKLFFRDFVINLLHSSQNNRTSNNRGAPAMDGPSPPPSPPKKAGGESGGKRRGRPPKVSLFTFSIFQPLINCQI